MLALLVEVQLARGDLVATEETRDQLAVLAVDRKDDRTRAVAKLVEGTLRAARGDQQARADFQAALELFSGLGLALEAAQARVALARALASPAGSSGRRGAARVEDI